MSVLVCIGLWPAGIRAASIAQDNWLITPEEAAMPAAPAFEGPLEPGSHLEIGREGADFGPIIQLIKPPDGAMPDSPAEIVIQFAARRDAIDLTSLKVWVVKLISIDITDRVRAFVSLQGIRIPDARLPSGQHTVRISLADVTGASTVKQATIKIQ